MRPGIVLHQKDQYGSTDEDHMCERINCTRGRTSVGGSCRSKNWKFACLDHKLMQVHQVKFEGWVV